MSKVYLLGLLFATVATADKGYSYHHQAGPNGLTPITPELIRQAYNVDASAFAPDPTGKNRQAVLYPWGNNMTESDLQAFLKRYGTPAQANQTFTRVGPIWPDNDPTDELALDMETMMGVAGPHVPTELWSPEKQPVGASCFHLKQLTDLALGRPDPPLVFTLSFGAPLLYLDERGCTAADRAEIEQNFEALGKRGVSIIVASGDAGSGYKDIEGLDFFSFWPACSPWVTAVGATKFTSQDLPSASKQAALELSSGGFVAKGVAPVWQQDATKEYLERARSSLPPARALFNAAGRGVPDVSMVGQFSYPIRLDGAWAWGGYTSAAAPTFAGLVSLLNGARLAQGLPPLGFLNPFLYANQDAFTDIVVGRNDGRRKDGRHGRTPENPNGIKKLPFGWSCEKGWDPATGLGTPDFQKLLEAALKWRGDESAEATARRLQNAQDQA